ncbi:MAG: YheC/YheD family protein [Myxococcota bacterium]|nr:YheC/YheD family protein [Myxococcota bacterium]
MHSALLVLVATTSPATAPPESRPLGRAALQLESEGIPVLFGDRIRAGRASGWRARPGHWEEDKERPFSAVHDRYPSEGRRSEWESLLPALDTVPLGNPPNLTLLCKDKLRCQRVLEGAGFHLPPVEGDERRFEQRLADWGAAFLKPRYGSRGEGIRLLRRGDPLPPDSIGPQLLQRAVEAPSGLAGLALRILVQRQADGGWWLGTVVARRSTVDPVVNAARGAQVVPAEDTLGADCLQEVRDQALAVARLLASRPGGALLLELGLDFVVDPAGLPQLIEVNSCPRGRLLSLASSDPRRYQELHRQACERPLRRLLALSSPRTAPA